MQKKQDIKHLQNHVQVFFAPHPLLPFFFSCCRLRSTWSDETVRWGKSFHEKKKQLRLPFTGLRRRWVWKERRKKTKNKTWSSFVVSLHPSFMFVREKPKQVFVSCSGKVLEPFLALKVSVTRNLRVLPSVLSADSSSNVNQFWDVWSKIWSL